MKKYQLLLLSILSGLLTGFGWPEYGFTPLLFICWVPLLWMSEELINRREEFSRYTGFFYTYPGFMVFNLLTTYWIWNATPLGAVLAWVLNSAVMSLAFSLYFMCRKRLYRGKKAWPVLIAFWVAYEYFHLDWDLSWPWLNLGNGFATKHTWIQWYEFTGVFGGTVWIWIVNILAFELLFLVVKKRGEKHQIIRKSLFIVLMIALPIIISLIRYSTYKEEGAKREVVVVQPNVDPYTEQYALPPIEITRRLIKLAAKKTDSNTAFIVCPESSIQEYCWEEQLPYSPSLFELRQFLKKYPQASFMVGMSTCRMLRPDEKPTPAARESSFEPNRYFEAYNTALLIDTTPNLPQYHKSKLTPGVEQMPLVKYLKPLEKLAFDFGGTVGSLGIDPERRVFEPVSKMAKVSPVICYESIYGEFVSEFVGNGAQLIFIITNDGWWGDTPGHRQHYSYASLRAIETRRCIARSANTGISAFINQRGDVLQRTKYWEPDVIKASLTLNDTKTFYVRYGDYLGRLAMLLSAGFLLLNFVIKYKDKRLKG